MDLTDLLPVVTATGPFATVSLDTSRDTEDAAAAIELRWRALRDRLREQGADDETLQALAVAATADRGTPGRRGRYLVAAHGEVLLDEDLPAPPRSEVAQVGRLPHLLPLVAERAVEVPYVRVVADRIGADVLAHGPDGDRETSRDGADHHIRKMPTGGWNQRRFQNTAEDLWSKNAAQVAEVVDREVLRVGARAVIAAGDADAITALEGRLGTRALELLVRVPEGSRADGADLHLLDDRVATEIGEIAARDVLDAVDRFRSASGSDGRAADGLAATLDALRQGKVETVLLHHDPSADGTLWAGEDPLVVGETRADVEALGATEPVQERADAVLLRAAAAAGSALTVVPRAELDLVDGVGALLRWSDRPGPGDTV